MVIVSQLATQLTHHLALKENIGGVRASSFLTLIFIALTSLFTWDYLLILQAVFLGSTFVGMTDPKRLSRVELVFASLIFCSLFHFFIHLMHGLGGTLGVSALMSCVLTYALAALNQRIRKT